MRNRKELLIDSRIKLKGALYIHSLHKNPSPKMIVIKLIMQCALNSINSEMEG